MKWRLGAAGFALLCASAVFAQAPISSPRPELRPTGAALFPDVTGVLPPASLGPSPSGFSTDAVTGAIAAAEALATLRAARANPAAVPPPVAAPPIEAPTANGADGAPIPPVTRVDIAPGAFAPSTSLRPLARGAPAAPEPTVQVPREGLFPGTAVPPLTVAPSATGLAVPRSLRPSLRPPGLEARVRAAATRTIPSQVTAPGQRGAVCGAPGLIGERLSPITGRLSGCGIQEPVRLREVNGIALSSPATVNCNTAEALQDWVEASAVPALRRRGGGLSSLRVIASYSCRTRNSIPGARLSEHARGNAIDISAFGLVNGTELTVRAGWGHWRNGRVMRRLHEDACGTFGTVLGPASDRFHRDHFHFDTAEHRSGPFCR